MKKLLQLILIVFFSAYAGNLSAAPVKVFSNSFSIWGSIWGIGQPFHDSYEEGGSIPLSNGVSSPEWVGWGDEAIASSRAGFFILEHLLAQVTLGPTLVPLLSGHFNRFPLWTNLRLIQ